MEAAMPDKRIEPIEGRSHWCDGWVRYGELRCGNVVSNDSDHCEAGHPNKLRDQNRSNSWPYPHSPPRLTVDSPLQDTASPEEPSYEIHDLAASSGAPPNIKPEMSWDDRMRSLPVGSIDINTSEGVKPDCRVCLVARAELRRRSP